MQKFSINTFLNALILTNLVFGSEINLLYTANINATYKHCNCGSNPLGGINRIKTYIDDFHSKNNNTLLIDGGNFFNSYSFKELNNSAFISLSMLNYDLLTPGFHIFLENRDLYNKYKKKYFKQIVNSNSNLNLNKFKDYKINDIKFRFFGFVSPNLFKYTKKPDWLKLSNQIHDLDYLEDGLNILVYNGYLSDAQIFLKSYNKFDALLLSSDQQTGTWQSGNTIIIGGGHDAESIALVEISVSGKSKEFKVSYIEMDSSIQSNKSIMQLFENLYSNNEKVKKD